MIFDSILNNIARHVKLTAAEADNFCTLLSVRQVKKKEFLVREGEISYRESYINKGCFRNYLVDKQGMEHNFYFAIEDWWISISGHQLQLLQQVYMTAEERYIAFRKKYPFFDQRIPQKHIASYLGLTPEFFNIIRSKVIRES